MMPRRAPGFLCCGVSLALVASVSANAWSSNAEVTLKVPVVGDLHLTVGDPSAFAGNEAAKTAVKKSLKEACGQNICDVELDRISAARRLGESERQATMDDAVAGRLLSGMVSVKYAIKVATAGVARSVAATLTSYSTANFEEIVNRELGTVGLPSAAVVLLTANSEPYKGLWTGPGSDGSGDYPVVEMVLVVVGAFLFAAIVGSLAAWKHKIVESAFEGAFERVGRMVGGYPIRTSIITLVIMFILCSGMGMQEAEVDAAKLWVPTGSKSLEYQDMVTEKWPSSTEPVLITAFPEDGEVGPNILTPEMLQALHAKHLELLAITVDGDKIVSDSMGIKDYSATYGGQWSFDGLNGTTKKKCVVWGPACAQQNILGIFGYDSTEIAALTKNAIIERIALWEATPRDSPLPGVSPMVFKSFEISDVLGGVQRDGGGRIYSAEVFSWFMFMTKVEEEVIGSDGRSNIQDPVNQVWEADAICILGVQEKHPTKEGKTCEATPKLKYAGLFARSFGDEFGGAIQGDLLNIIFAYYLIIGYLIFNLGKRDVVHSMFTMSFVTILCVGLSFAGGSGLGGFFGIKTNPLNNNIPFLILGLGVDDAFVLSSEFVRHSIANPEAAPAERIALTSKTGGMSVLVTSLTDALAFLVGGSTKLPALSAFCLYAGISVVICFALQIFLFLPLLSLNARRADDNRYDCLCCVRSNVEHKITEPQGICCCICVPQCNCRDGLIQRLLTLFAKYVIKTSAGKICTLVVWTIILICGIIGTAQVKKDFKVEWFFPEGSYVFNYITLNDKYFSSGTTFDFYLTDMNVYDQQAKMNELSSYIRELEIIQQSTVDNWWFDFTNGRPVQYTDTTEFWADLLAWYRKEGNPYTRVIKWTDANCHNPESTSCSPSQGIADSKIGATLQRFPDGKARYEALVRMREDTKNIFEDDKIAFPFSQEMLYWEEFGIIDQELSRNLFIAGGIIFAIICLLIPKLSIALLVAALISMTILEVVGFMHFWGVNVNGPSTIYLLICVGLAVDYSAHIAHVFKTIDGEGTYGSREECAATALIRIGPSVFQAVLSTLLALCVLAFSKSYVFEVFFKILFLVTTIGGFKGIWLLPVCLSLPVPGEAQQSAETVVTAVEPADKDAAGNAKAAGTSATETHDAQKQDRKEIQEDV